MRDRTFDLFAQTMPAGNGPLLRASLLLICP